MPAKRRGRQQQKHAASDDSSDDDAQLVDGRRYALLNISDALSHPRSRVGALDELKCIFEQCYAERATKDCQLALFNDLLAAVWTGCCTSKEQAALTQAVRSAERVLPPKKRGQLQSEFKRASVTHRRAHRRPGSHGEDSDDEAANGFGELPLEVVEAVLMLLYPVDLASCMRVCRLWRQLSSGCGSWGVWVADMECRLGRGRRPARPGQGPAQREGQAQGQTQGHHCLMQQNSHQQQQHKQRQQPQQQPQAGPQQQLLQQPQAGPASSSSLLEMTQAGSDSTRNGPPGAGGAAGRAGAGAGDVGTRSGLAAEAAGAEGAAREGGLLRSGGGHAQFSRLVSGRPARLLHWTAQRWMAPDGRLLWRADVEPHLNSKAQLHFQPLAGQQVVEWLCHGRVLSRSAISSSDSSSASDSSEDEAGGKGHLRFWSLSISAQ